MYPILYESISVGVVPQDNGLGILSDAISCTIEQERNGAYELILEYSVSGIHAQDLAIRRIIKAKPNFTDDPQLFRIDRIGKEMNGKFTVYAKHISYDLSGYEITSGTASSISGACLLLQNAASGYTITTDKTTAGTFKVNAPASVKSFFVGKEGSILDVYGKADIKYNNFSVQFLTNAGADRGVTIRYKKNLLELSQETDGSNLYTHVICFWKSGENAAVYGSKVATGLTLDVPKTLIVDVSDEYQDAPSTTVLTNRATAYINANNLTIPTNNIKLDFVQSGELANRVDLCDSVNIYYEALGITRVGVKCIRTRYDCIREKYLETEFGDATFNVADTIAVASRSLAEKPNTSYMSEAIAHATEMITGNLGGYVIMHDANGDGKPDEILVMNTEDITTASQVWRFNKSGLGYSNSYGGSYGLALTSDGQIVADRITSGTLNANIIKAGVISDVNGNSSIDMTSGVAKMKNFDAVTRIRLLNASNAVKWQLVHNVGSGVNMTFYNESGTDCGGFSSTADGGILSVLDSSGVLRARVYNTGRILLYDSSGKKRYDNSLGNMYTYNSSGNVRMYSAINSYDRGQITLYDESGTGQANIYGDGAMSLTSNISLYGPTGVITCVRCDQTSSIKVKKNIEDISDSEKILELQAVKFDYKDENLGKDQRGFIAENVAEILPNLVSGGETPAIHYTGMIPYLQDVVKKQQKRIDDLENRLKALEDMVKSGKGE